MPMIPDWTRAGIEFSFSPSTGAVTAHLPDGTSRTIQRDRYDDGWEIVGHEAAHFMDGFRSDEEAEDWIVDRYGKEEQD